MHIPMPAPSGAYGGTPSIAGAMQNSFSWPAKQVSYMDVANKLFQTISTRAIPALTDFVGHAPHVQKLSRSFCRTAGVARYVLVPRRFATSLRLSTKICRNKSEQL
jgi:hypothetical protein